VLNSPVLSQRKLRQLAGAGASGRRRQSSTCNYDERGLKEAARAHLSRPGRSRRARRRTDAAAVRPLHRTGQAADPRLLATGAVHHRLTEKGLRCDCNILVETGTARDPHHFACLIGFGASAVYPYLAYQTLFDMT
jgi:glutamate synthase (NADPH/NADH) large chain